MNRETCATQYHRFVFVLSVLIIGCGDLSVPTDMQGSTRAYRCTIPQTECTLSGCYYAGVFEYKLCAINEGTAKASCAATCGFHLQLVIDSEGNLVAEMPSPNPSGQPGVMIQCCGLDISSQIGSLNIPESIKNIIMAVYNNFCKQYYPAVLVQVDNTLNCPSDYYGSLGYGDGPEAPFVAVPSNTVGKFVSTGQISGEFDGQSAISNGIFTFDMPRSCQGSTPCVFVLKNLSAKVATFEVEDEAVTNTILQLRGPVVGTVTPSGYLSVPKQGLVLLLNFDVQGKHGSTRLDASTPLTGTVDLANSVLRIMGHFTIQSGSNSGIAPGDLNLTLRFEGPITEQPPTADTSRTPRTVECNRHGGATLTLDGTASTDPDGYSDLTSFLWTISTAQVLPLFLAAGPTAEAFLPLGWNTIALHLYDKGADLDVDDLKILVKDTVGPNIGQINVEPRCLWPPNHKLVRFELDKQVVSDPNDTCDSNPTIRIKQITSSESEDEKGQGNSNPDIYMGENAFCVRAERAGTGVGRVYTVTLEATDKSGNSTTQSFGIVVPHDQSTNGVFCPELPESIFLKDGDKKCSF